MLRSHLGNDRLAIRRHSCMTQAFTTLSGCDIAVDVQIFFCSAIHVPALTLRKDVAMFEEPEVGCGLCAEAA